MRINKALVGAFAALTMFAAGGLAAEGAGVTERVKIQADGPAPAKLMCPGGMTNMGYELNEDGSVFPYDPATHVNDIYTVAADFFEVERVTISSHAGTHLDVPRHFVDGARGLTDLGPEEFVWPAYKIDVAELGLADGQLQISIDDIVAYENEHGRIGAGSLVVLDTVVADEFNLDDPGDERIVDGDDLAQNVDDLFDSVANEGLSGDAINWLFAERQIAGVGSDAYGPDAADDGDFLATYNTLANGGVALVALDNVETLSVNSDIIIAPTVRLSAGSGFPTNPIACHGGAAGRG